MLITYTCDPNTDRNHRPKRLDGVVDSVVVSVCTRVNVGMSVVSVSVCVSVLV